MSHCDWSDAHTSLAKSYPPGQVVSDMAGFSFNFQLDGGQHAGMSGEAVGAKVCAGTVEDLIAAHEVHPLFDGSAFPAAQEVHLTSSFSLLIRVRRKTLHACVRGLQLRLRTNAIMPERSGRLRMVLTRICVPCRVSRLRMLQSLTLRARRPAAICFPADTKVRQLAIKCCVQGACLRHSLQPVSHCVLRKL